jgi:methionyl-tRNA formyltransferase
VVAAYGLILPSAALDAPKLGCLNIHASLLPRWRGAAPIQRAVLAGDRSTGITIMRMEERLDTGPMLASRAIDIGLEDTAGSLHDRLAALGAELIRDTLDALASGPVRETPQPEAGVSYAEKIKKSEALIDWREDAALLARRVRAFNPTPVAETRWGETQLRIWQAEPVGEGGATTGKPLVPPGSVLDASDEGIRVSCGSGSLRITRLQLAGRKPLPATEFLRAHALTGARFTGP